MITVLQIFVGIAMLFLIFSTVSRFRKNKISLLSTIFFLFVWVGVLLFAFLPGFFGPISKLVNTSPADLAVRIGLIMLFYLIFVINNKITDMQSQIKKLGEYIGK